MSEDKLLLADIQRFCLTRGVSIEQCLRILSLDRQKISISQLKLEQETDKTKLPKSILLKISQCPLPGVTDILVMSDNKYSIIAKI